MPQTPPIRELRSRVQAVGHELRNLHSGVGCVWVLDAGVQPFNKTRRRARTSGRSYRTSPCTGSAGRPQSAGCEILFTSLGIPYRTPFPRLCTAEYQCSVGMFDRVSYDDGSLVTKTHHTDIDFGGGNASPTTTSFATTTYLTQLLVLVLLLLRQLLLLVVGVLQPGPE